MWTLARQFSPFRTFSAMFFPNLFLTEYYKDKLRTICDSYLLKRRLHYFQLTVDHEFTRAWMNFGSLAKALRSVHNV